MKELLDKYFNGNISKEEAAEIQQYFSAHPDELEKYFSHEEWDAGQYEELQNELLSEHTIDSWFETQSKKTKQNRRNLSMALVLSCLVLIIGSTWFLGYWGAMRAVTPSTKHLVTTYENKKESLEKIILIDSSQVTLYPHAQITLASDYNFTNRNVVLNGKAVFQVHKNDLKKFTVFAGNIATTAVGTIFSVDNSETQKVNIQLIEGKILVRDKRSRKKSYYLLPGNGITYFKKTNQFDLSNQPKGVTLEEEQEAKARRLFNLEVMTITPTITGNPTIVDENIITTDQEASFLDAKLPNVLKTLAEIYQVKIAYPAAKASTIRFSGKLNRTDDIGKILSDIAIMNNFTLDVDTANHSFRLY